VPHNDPNEEPDIVVSEEEDPEGEPLGKRKMPPVPLPDTAPQESNSEVQ
jgi:hypothetical protein